MRKEPKEHRPVMQAILGGMFEVLLYFPRLIAAVLKALF